MRAPNDERTPATAVLIRVLVGVVGFSHPDDGVLVRLQPEAAADLLRRGDAVRVGALVPGPQDADCKCCVVNALQAPSLPQHEAGKRLRGFPSEI